MLSANDICTLKKAIIEVSAVISNINAAAIYCQLHATRHTEDARMMDAGCSMIDDRYGIVN
jgi:hypothetical protein